MNGNPGRHTAGVDEAGRGPLAGPVVVAAVILDPEDSIHGLDDSKRLSEAARVGLYEEITARSLAWSVIEISHDEIDRLNILNATMFGMQQAVAALTPAADVALIDGNRAPDLACPARTIIQGDRLEPAISAASIIAKVTRDRRMRELHRTYPDYGFDRHKGYGTRQHLESLERFGPCPIHRRSFAPVRRLLQSGLF
ncbi:ribonuclease HII [Elongatibacter sediminis]|uniref:Ribonuclease HII n=1 Tax=Elongatibacter sediminis TaxID=3119006 RepID=A0AAW9RLK9_9GAMM